MSTTKATSETCLQGPVKEGACAWGKQMRGLPSCCSWIAKTRMGLFEDKVPPDLTIDQIDDHILLLKLLFFHGMNPHFQMLNISMEPATARYRNPLLLVCLLFLSLEALHDILLEAQPVASQDVYWKTWPRVSILGWHHSIFGKFLSPKWTGKILHGFFSNPTSKSLSSEVSAGILMAVIQSSMGGSESTIGDTLPSSIGWPAGKPA